MKKSIPLLFAGSMALSLFLLPSCQKVIDIFKDHDDDHHGQQKLAKHFSSEVPVKWLNLQLRLTKVPPGVAGANPQRLLAYCGIALYESVMEGMPSYQTLSRQLTDMPAMPKAQNGKDYHWPTCANAALAFMNRNLLAAAPDASKASIDSLENALNEVFKTQTSSSTFERSAAYGKAIAQLVFDWSKTDGALNVNPPYTPPGTLAGAPPGLWVPFPSTAVPVMPYAGTWRLLVKGSHEGSEPAPPPAYSTSSSSDYYAMAKDVYDVSQSLTPEQTAIALYYRDVPGYPGGGHYISILAQVFVKANASLDMAALAYSKSGIAMFDALIACWKTKYTVNLERPVQSIRGVVGQTAWLPLFNAPAHPEFPSAHSNQAEALQIMLSSVFGNRFEFTNHTYDYLGMAPRHYDSFSQMAEEIGISRLYAGIHYRASVEKGGKQGNKIAKNILQNLRFKKW